MLAAAQQLFADRGTSVPVDEIARAAGVGVGTVHRHFLTKDDLVDAALIASCEPIFGLLETAAADPDAGHALEQLLLELTEHQSRHRGLAERMRETDDLSPAVVEVKQQIAAGLRAVVASASCWRRPSSSLLRVILNWFCWAMSSSFLAARSGLSILTTRVNSWSSRPCSVTVKLISVHSA